jgi:thiamine phosphate synthase YjbQ (UPF0047 family)
MKTLQSKKFLLKSLSIYSREGGNCVAYVTHENGSVTINGQYPDFKGEITNYLRM